MARSRVAAVEVALLFASGVEAAPYARPYSLEGNARLKGAGPEWREISTGQGMELGETTSRETEILPESGVILEINING